MSSWAMLRKSKHDMKNSMAFSSGIKIIFDKVHYALYMTKYIMHYALCISAHRTAQCVVHVITLKNLLVNQ